MSIINDTTQMLEFVCFLLDLNIYDSFNNKDREDLYTIYSTYRNELNS